MAAGRAAIVTAAGIGGGWPRTLRQAVPKLFALLPRLDPTWDVPSAARLDEAILTRDDVDGVIWDVDGTLMKHHGEAVDPAVAPAFRALLVAGRLRHVILSNCGEERFRALGRIFPEVPVLLGYDTGDGLVARRLFQGRDSVDDDPRAARLAAAGTAVRKPSAALVDLAVAELGCPRERVVMVGDQRFTDVAGANLAGIRSIKVPTIDPRSFPLPVRAMQRFEGALYAMFYRGSRAASDRARVA